MLKLEEQFTRAWTACPYLSPRQAFAIAGTLQGWADSQFAEWLRDPSTEPLHCLVPFDEFDPRVMVLVGESREWVEKVSDRCRAIAVEISRGVLPFHRGGSYIDELLVAASLAEARAQLTDMPELFSEVPARPAVEVDPARGSEQRSDGDLEEVSDVVADDEWEAVEDAFDDLARWAEWNEPLVTDHPHLQEFLATHHPFSWFDPA